MVKKGIFRPMEKPLPFISKNANVNKQEREKKRKIFRNHHVAIEDVVG